MRTGMERRPAAVALGLVAIGLVTPTAWPGDAAAQSSGRNPATAQALYDEARQLIQAGKYSEACPKFDESYKLDPGGGTLLNLADCYEKEGKIALAWSTFIEAMVVAQRDGRRDRVEFAGRHIAFLESRLAHLTIQVPEGVRRPGLTITLDDSPLGEAGWGVAVPVDPGRHVVRAEAPGKRPFETSVDVAAGNAVHDAVEIPPLADAALEMSRGARAGGSGVTPSDGEQSHSRSLAGWIVGGVGIASIGVGSYFGLRAFSRWSDRNAECVPACSQEAKSAGEDANQSATISDIGFGAGLAAVAVGAYLVLSARADTSSTSRTASTVRVAPEALKGGAAVSIGGRW